jgi:hypothetical protein
MFVVGSYLAETPVDAPLEGVLGAGPPSACRWSSLSERLPASMAYCAEAFSSQQARSLGSECVGVVGSQDLQPVLRSSRYWAPAWSGCSASSSRQAEA